MTKKLNKIEKLIAELCPEGVEFRELGEVCKILRGKRLTRKELLDDGDYPVFHGGLIPLGRYDKFNRRANQTMVINTGSVGEVVWSSVDFWSSDGTFVVETSNNIDDKYLYYFLKIQEPYLKTQKREGGVPTINRQAVEKLKIPIPPLQVQEEIVKILDNFTELEAELKAELKAELEARKKQYEYYKSELLEKNNNYEQVVLEDIAEYSKNRIPAENLDKKSYIGVDSLLQNRKGRKDSNHVPATGNSTQYNKEDILIGNIRPYLKKIWFSDRLGGTNGDVLVVSLKESEKEKISPRFLYYILSSDNFFEYNMQNAKGAKMPRGNKKAIMKYSFLIPPLSKQKEIVEVLDKFDALVNDISVGLPAEIKARKQQYEYYREQLLTFNEKK